VHVGPKMRTIRMGLPATVGRMRLKMCRGLMGLEGHGYGPGPKTDRMGPRTRWDAGPVTRADAETGIRADAEKRVRWDARAGIRWSPERGVRLAGLRGCGGLMMRGSGGRLILMGCRGRTNLT
jgi:hypothetical protein